MKTLFGIHLRAGRNHATKMKSIIQYLHEIFYLLGDDRKKLAWLIILFLFSSLLDVASIGLIAPYVGLVVSPESLGNGFFRRVVELLELPNEQAPVLLIVGFSLLGLFFMKAVAAIYVNRKIITFSQNQQVRLRSCLMEAYQRLEYTDYLRRNSAEYIHSVQTLTGQFATGVVLVVLRALSDGIVALVILALLAWTNGPALGILVGLLGSLVFGYDRLFRRHIRLYGQKANDAATLMIKGIHEGIEGLKEIRILGKEAYFSKMVHEGAAEYAKNFVKSQMVSTTPRYLLEFMMIAFVVLLVISTLLLKQNLQMLVPTLAVFGVAALRLLPSANSISTSLIQTRYNRHSVSRLYADLSSIKGMKKQPTFPSVELNIGEPFIALELRNVRFHYPNAGMPALNNISLKISAGESIGFIGASGSGKTTLVDLLLGLLQPQEGELLYNGTPLNQKIAAWRSQVAYLPQQVFLTDDSVRKNIALGMDEEEIEEGRLLEAMRQARLIDVVEQLPQGSYTLLGERGVRLSGGQRQRVALARAFFHKRSVLVMDEATSALDNETEDEIVAEIKRLKGNKTTIVIAHRLTTVQHCDRIYRLQNGEIVDTGTPQQILSLKNSLNPSIGAG